MTPVAKPIRERSDIQRLRVFVRGAVQGVGFRPFIYRLALELRLMGWVSNSPQGVSIEVEGHKTQLQSFLLRIEREKPPRSFIQGMESSYLDASGFSKFEIRESVSNGSKTAIVLPDIGGFCILLPTARIAARVIR
jgi:hydrogenase maturation protein HypF